MSHRFAPPEVIYIIRHGEKPEEPAHKRSAPAHRGVDYQGNPDEHSLLPRGWQRSGALAALFDPGRGPSRPGLHVPRTLVSPAYGERSKSGRHRTYQTISGISERLGIAIAADYAKGQEAELAAALARSGPGAVLVCWDHARIPALATALPLVGGTVIPATWPADRFDVIWAFTLAAGDAYSFAQVPQLLLSGDKDAVIVAG
jgi:hypothetical protein